MKKIALSGLLLASCIVGVFVSHKTSNTYEARANTSEQPFSHLQVDISSGDESLSVGIDTYPLEQRKISPFFKGPWESEGGDERLGGAEVDKSFVEAEEWLIVNASETEAVRLTDPTLQLNLFETSGDSRSGWLRVTLMEGSTVAASQSFELQPEGTLSPTNTSIRCNSGGYAPGEFIELSEDGDINVLQVNRTIVSACE